MLSGASPLRDYVRRLSYSPSILQRLGVLQDLSFVVHFLFGHPKGVREQLFYSQKRYPDFFEEPRPKQALKEDFGLKGLCTLFLIQQYLGISKDVRNSQLVSDNRP